MNNEIYNIWNMDFHIYCDDYYYPCLYFYIIKRSYVMENTMLTNLAEIKGNLDSLNDTFEKILNDLLSEKSKSPDGKNNFIIKNEIASAQGLYDELKQYPIQQRLK